jgi:hypothetical protein
MTSGLLVHCEKVFCCLGAPSRVRIPGDVCELGDFALVCHKALFDLIFEEGKVQLGKHLSQHLSSS